MHPMRDFVTNHATISRSWGDKAGKIVFLSENRSLFDFHIRFQIFWNLKKITFHIEKCEIAWSYLYYSVTLSKQSHTSRKNDVFIVLESETTLPLIIVVIIQNRRKITPQKNLDQFPFLLFTDIYSSSIRTFWVSN